MRLLNTVLAATAAASFMVITIDAADAQSRNGGGNRSFGGGGSSFARPSGGGGGSALRQSVNPGARQSVASRSAASGPGSRVGQQQFNQRQPQAIARQSGVTPQQGNRRPGVGNQQANNGQPGNRGPAAGNQQANNGQPGNRGPAAGNQQANNGQPGNRGPAAGNQQANNGQPGNRGPAAGNQQANNGQPGNRGPVVGNQPGNAGQPGNGARPLAPELRSGLGAGGGSFGRNNALPVHRAVAAHGHQSGRSGLPLALTPKHTLHKAVHANLHHSYRPFVQRHWKRAFFWIAVAGIGYVTVPEFGYDRFLTYVERDEPDYAGAARWLNELTVIEEGHDVPRVTPPAKIVPQAIVAVAPDTKYDDRFDRFVNRRWSTSYVWIMVPRVGNVTVPQTIAPQVEQMLGGNPPNFDAALAMMEEAAAADTVVAEAPQVESPTAQQ